MQKDERLRLLWVGDGWRKESRLALARRHRRSNCCDGMVPTSEIPSLIQSCDLLVHPSYREGLPQVVVQAMPAGVPWWPPMRMAREKCASPRRQVDWCPSAMLTLRPPSRYLDHPQPQQWAEEAEASVRTEFTVDAMVDALEAACMPSCWLEAVVLLFGQTFGLAGGCSSR